MKKDGLTQSYTDSYEATLSEQPLQLFSYMYVNNARYVRQIAF